jgi:hypothetical protein
VGKSRRTAKEAGQKSEVDARFLNVIAAFARDRSVTHGGKGFGSTGLKVNGKLFAFVSPKGQFVVKVPKTRVAELVAAHHAEPFDPGHGRLMKEWVAVRSSNVGWTELAREAHRFVKGLSS